MLGCVHTGARQAARHRNSCACKSLRAVNKILNNLTLAHRPRPSVKFSTSLNHALNFKIRVLKFTSVLDSRCVIHITL